MHLPGNLLTTTNLCLIYERSFVHSFVRGGGYGGWRQKGCGAEDQEAILEAARLLFLRQGYHATGMREIAHDAGISLGAVYNHFISKEEILREILDERNLYRAMSEALSRAKFSGRAGR